MREIKLRAKYKGIWVYGSLIKKTLFNGEIAYDIEDADESNYRLYNIEKADHETIGQYTGLKDKNGVEIYEGDKLHNPNDKELFYIIEWDDKQGGFSLGLDGNGLRKYQLSEFWEVIGNIYEDKLATEKENE